MTIYVTIYRDLPPHCVSPWCMLPHFCQLGSLVSRRINKFDRKVATLLYLIYLLLNGQEQDSHNTIPNNCPRTYIQWTVQFNQFRDENPTAKTPLRNWILLKPWSWAVPAQWKTIISDLPRLIIHAHHQLKKPWKSTGAKSTIVA